MQTVKAQTGLILKRINKLLDSYKTPQGKEIGRKRILDAICEKLSASWQDSRGNTGGEGVQAGAGGCDRDQSPPNPVNPQLRDTSATTASAGSLPTAAMPTSPLPTPWYIDDSGKPLPPIAYGPPKELPVEMLPTAAQAIWQPAPDSDLQASASTVPVAVETTVSIGGVVEGGEVARTLTGAQEWPDRGIVVIDGPCLNPRLVTGKLKNDGRRVRLWRGARNMRRGLEITARLDRTVPSQMDGYAGVEPIYVPC